MFRATIWRAVFLVYAAVTPAVQAAPLPPDRQWDEVDTQREEQLLRENVAVGLERLTLAQAYLETLLTSLEGMEPERRGSAVRAVRQRLAHAQEALDESAGLARWLTKQRANDPNGLGPRFHVRSAALTRLAQDARLVEQALEEFEKSARAQQARPTIAFLALEALARLKVDLVEVERNQAETEDVERIVKMLLEMRRAAPGQVDLFGNRKPSE